MFHFEKMVDGRRYRMVAQSQRVPGKKHPVSRQVCLGPVHDNEPFVPSQCEVAGRRRVGDVGALLFIANQLGVVAAFDEAVPRRGKGPSLGEMILAVALQRVCAPAAKRALPEFLQECLPRLSLLGHEDFSGAAFHRLTRAVPEDVYERVQLALAQQACELYRLKTDVLAYDTSNFDTFIATASKSTLAQRGHAKSKRSDLKVVGLALMTSGTGSVPLFHRTYAGNENDKTVLGATLDSLGRLHEGLGKADRTLVRDGGFAGEQLDLGLERSGYHSVTVLPLSSTVSREALRVAAGNLKSLPGKLCDIGAWRTRVSVDGRDRTLVVVESPELLAGQMRGLRLATTKARAELRKLARRLERQRQGQTRGRRYTRASVERKVEKLTRREHVHEVLKVEIGGEDTPSLAVSIDAVARRRLVVERLGKRVIITDQHEWSTERIVRTFRSQWKVERAFRRMKRGAVSPWGPSWQWTDDSLRAHTFAVVLGLQLASLAALRLRAAGVKLPVRASMRMLGGICMDLLRERTGKRGRPRQILVPHRLTAEAARAIPLFGLAEWTGFPSTTRRNAAGRPTTGPQRD